MKLPPLGLGSAAPFRFFFDEFASILVRLNRLLSMVTLYDDEYYLTLWMTPGL